LKSPFVKGSQHVPPPNQHIWLSAKMNGTLVSPLRMHCGMPKGTSGLKWVKKYYPIVIWENCVCEFTSLATPHMNHYYISVVLNTFGQACDVHISVSNPVEIIVISFLWNKDLFHCAGCRAYWMLIDTL